MRTHKSVQVYSKMLDHAGPGNQLQNTRSVLETSAVIVSVICPGACRPID